jgi:phage shock protein C
MTKKLYRSRTNKMIAGVCAGLGDFFELDPTLIRLGAVVLVLAAGVGILAYIVAWIIVPQQPWDSVGK